MRSPQLTNPKVNLPLQTLCEIPSILTEEEASKLSKAIDGEYYRAWCPEGYDRRHRVQRYSSENENESHGGYDVVEDSVVSMEEAFGWIFDRIVKHHSSRESGDDDDSSPSPSSVKMHRPFEVVVIEHTPSTCRSEVTTFEQNNLCPCSRQQQQKQQSQNPNDNDIPNSSCCNCYVAQLTLMNNAIQSIEKPLTRELECWDLAEPTEHSETNIVMEQNGVLVKRGESLWNWRGRISNVQDENDVINAKNGTSGSSDAELYKGMSQLDIERAKKKEWKRIKKLNKAPRYKKCIVVNFRGIVCQTTSLSSKEEVKIMSMIPKEVKPSLPLSKLLTIIVTTSPIRSHPSTEMLEHTFETFHFAGEEFAYSCPKVIICDGCRVLDEERSNGGGSEEKKDNNESTPKITRKYANTKQTLRNGIATIDQAKNYTEFKARLRKLCEEANNEPSSQSKNPFRNTKVVELEERHGYGFALRHALYHNVDTPYVCVIQHDRTFMRPTPVTEVVCAMENDPNQQIKYVGMSMRSNLMYHDIFSGKYGRRAVEDFKKMILYPEELCIGDNLYGADGTSLENMSMPNSEKRKNTLESLKETYRGAHQYNTYDERMNSSQEQHHPPKDGFHQLSLTPTLFWYDNTHIVNTAHYRDFIFHPQFKMVARGGFVEDKLSPAMIRSCERLGLKDGHAKFGCYILDDHSGAVFTGHLDGGSYMTADLHYRDSKNERCAAEGAQDK